MHEVHAGSAPIALALFGAFQMAAGGKTIILRARKACALLAFLALARDHRAGREQIADLLWTDRAAEQARASLRQTLAELRNVEPLAAVLTIDRNNVSLDARGFTSDMADVLAAAALRDIVALASALRVIEGDLLESFGDVSPRFDDWLAAERPARRAQIVSESLACAEEVGMTALEEAQAVLRALDRIDPANEGVARLGMRLDHAAADSAALHRRYRRLADQLLREFGAAPTEATRTLFHQLTRTAPDVDQSEAGRSANAQKKPSPGKVEAVAPAMTGDLMPAVVVAPLQLMGNTSFTQAQAEFCSDDMRVAISAMPGIRVLAVDNADIDTLVAQSTDSLAIYLLSGKVRDPGSGEVATLQLADARRHTILWTASLPLAGVSNPCDTIVAKAVGALQPAIDRDLEGALRLSPDWGDERAMYTRARLIIRSATDLQETLAGVAALERLVEQNPRHLGAHLLLGRMYNNDYWQQMTGHDTAALRERGAKHLEIAARLAPDRVEVRVRRAWVLLRRGAYDSAVKEFDAVLGQRQLDADILNQCAFGLCFLGDIERAQALMQQAFELNPFAPSDYHADYATMKALAGKAEEAEDHFLVSGETGLLYDAVRIANFSALAVLPPSADEVEARFATKFAAAWQASGSPAGANVIEWIGTVLPLRQQEHRDFVTRGLEQRLPLFWPAS